MKASEQGVLTSTQVYLINLLHCSLQAEALVGHVEKKTSSIKNSNTSYSSSVIIVKDFQQCFLGNG